MDAQGNPQCWAVEEQIVDDPVSGLSFQFEVLPTGRCALRIFGMRPHSSFEIVFDRDGRDAAVGMTIGGPTKPTWLLPCDL